MKDKVVIAKLPATLTDEQIRSLLAEIARHPTQSLCILREGAPASGHDVDRRAGVRKRGQRVTAMLYESLQDESVNDTLR